MNKQQLAAKIWESANRMRGKVDASEYKDFILGFIFYKYLSEKEEQFFLGEGMTAADMEQLVEEDEETVGYAQNHLGYFISYQNLFSTWIQAGNDFAVSQVYEALSAFSRLVSPLYKNVFDGIFITLQTGLSKLGDNTGSQTKAVRDLVHLIQTIPMSTHQDYDVLGYIYEDLISKFASNAGKKAGEFYTPHEVSVLMADIVAHHLRSQDTIRIYDPTERLRFAAHHHRRCGEASHGGCGRHRLLCSGAQPVHLQSHAHEPRHARHQTVEYHSAQRRYLGR